jgi:hypothetical protein
MSRGKVTTPKPKSGGGGGASSKLKPVKSKRSKVDPPPTLFVAVLTAAIAVLIYFVLFSGKSSRAAEPVAVAAAERHGAGVSAIRTELTGASGVKRKLSDFELRQQGRKPPGWDRPRCVDGGRCRGVSAEQCAEEEVRKRCYHSRAMILLAPRASLLARLHLAPLPRFLVRCSSLAPSAVFARMLGAEAVLPQLFRKDVRGQGSIVHRTGAARAVLPAGGE